MPVVEHYEKEGKIVKVNADRDPEDIYTEVKRAWTEFVED